MSTLRSILVSGARSRSVVTMEPHQFPAHLNQPLPIDPSLTALPLFRFTCRLSIAQHVCQTLLLLHPSEQSAVINVSD